MDRKKKNKNDMGLRIRLKYWFDNRMSGGTVSKILLLLIFCIMVTLFLACIAALVGGGNGDYSRPAYVIGHSFLHTFDPGNFTGDEGGKGMTIVMLIITLFGMLFSATLIGIINNGLEDYMDELQKGNSKVIEKNHTIILGFNEVTYEILHELYIANENQKNQVIVIMDNAMEKSEMDERIHKRILSDIFMNSDNSDLKSRLKDKARYSKSTKVISRKGHIYDAKDLYTCSIESCRSIIVNADDDYHTIRAIMACSTIIEKLKEEHSKEDGWVAPYITAVIQDRNNERAARIAGRGDLELICYSDIMSRIMANSSRTPGLSYVYTELFNYEGDEIYCVNLDETKNDKQFAASLLDPNMDIKEINNHLVNAIVVGGLTDYNEQTYDDGILDKSEYCLLPSLHNKKLSDFKKLYILEEDDDEVDIRQDEICGSIDNIEKPDFSLIKAEMLIIGVSELLTDVLDEYNQFFGKNSYIYVADTPDRIKGYDNGLLTSDEAIRGRFPNINIVPFAESDIHDFNTLSNLLTDENHEFQSVLILADKDEEPDKADDKTISLLLYLRQIRNNLEKIGKKKTFSITCEMNLDQNRRLAEQTGREDYVVGSKVTALITTMIAQNRELHQAFMEILSNDGSEIYMIRAGDFVNGEKIGQYSFHALAGMFMKWNMVLIGYRQVNNDGTYRDPVLNPGISDTSAGIGLRKDDYLIVIAEGPDC